MNQRALAERIAAARARVGLTQQQFSDAVSLGRDKIAKIETGARKVTALDLLTLADGLGVGVDWLLSDPPPAVAAYRRDLAPDAPTRPIDVTLETLIRDVDFVTTHDSRLPKLVGDERSLSDRAAAEQLASESRRAGGLTPTEPLRHVANFALKLGALVFSQALGADGAPEGASAPAEHCGVAIVNGSLDVGRRRLVAAHELAHLLTRDGWTIDFGDDDDVAASAAESRSDQFARALLVPEEAARRAFTDLIARDETDIRQLVIGFASDYAVDMSTLARRLLDLRLVDDDRAREIRSYRTTKADIIDFDLVNRRDLEAPSAPRDYERTVLGLYRREIITAERAVDLLHNGFTDADIPARDPLPEDSVWSML